MKKSFSSQLGNALRGNPDGPDEVFARLLLAAQDDPGFTRGSFPCCACQ